MTSQFDRPLVLITGSSGLIGSRVVEDLAGDYRVVGFDVEAPPALPDAADFIECDLTDDWSLRRAMDRLAADHGPHLASVIHLAAYYDFAGEPSPLYEALTVHGTRRLLHALQGLEVEQLVFSSTMLVMKPAELGETITEDSPLQAEWDYPQSKIDTEQLLRDEHGDIPVVILRLAGVYDDYGHSPPITQQIKRINERQLKGHLFPGHPEHSQPFVHLDDAVAAFRCAVERRQTLAPFELFLIAEPSALSYERLQERLGQLIHGEYWDTVRIPAPLAKAGAWVEDKLSDDAFIKPWMVDLADAHYPISIERARRLLGWSPHHELDRTLPAIVARLRRQPGDFYADNKLGAPP